MKVMNRNEALEIIENIVNGDRAVNYGKPEDTFKMIADFWSTYLGFEIEPKRVPQMMMLMKLARLANNPDHIDSIIDCGGYAVVNVELADVKQRNNNSKR